MKALCALGMLKPNKTDAGNGSYGICRVIDPSRSPSPDLMALGDILHSNSDNH